ncbi:uncharacterized protein cubi_00013 [Cryptosporidium ubiquitum]|uniref:Uncharacterized protein n=1 Tax=Cryptosporidium ubiquitum TaxID=857276 RepID=A0A1J4MN51_9CRYT|nr:uncharacterized protein cubi_00013 [Cryptosporidium ubiquitum]OII74460.1 hypothetical protein cubi_00013 [Cryptosporidium ubiquitum]
MNIHNRSSTTDYSCYYDFSNAHEYYQKYDNNMLINQNNSQYPSSIYKKGLSAQGPNFLHSNKMNLSTVKLDINNNAPALMNTLIEKNKEIKNMEKELKIINESNIFLNNKIEMLKILAANFGATQEDIEATMSTNDVFCIPKPSVNVNYPQTDSSCENLRENIEDELDDLIISDKNIVKFNIDNHIEPLQNDPDKKSKSISKSTKIKQQNEAKNEKTVDIASKNFESRSSTLFKSTKSLINSIQAQKESTNKYLTGTRFGPSVRQKAIMQVSANKRLLSSKTKNI